MGFGYWQLKATVIYLLVVNSLARIEPRTCDREYCYERFEGESDRYSNGDVNWLRENASYRKSTNTDFDATLRTYRPIKSDNQQQHIVSTIKLGNEHVEQRSSDKSNDGQQGQNNQLNEREERITADRRYNNDERRVIVRSDDKREIQEHGRRDATERADTRENRRELVRRFEDRVERFASNRVFDDSEEQRAHNRNTDERTGHVDESREDQRELVKRFGEREERSAATDHREKRREHGREERKDEQRDVSARAQTREDQGDLTTLVHASEDEREIGQ
ncbi:PREDICTED: nucleolar protein 58-like, partial [Rhagoletis zephyria]|uniref:nucleolar protein 58-like n=1 Tax=Rhagoletis zephyria TaxID=28612 RepID=UPI0008117502